MYICVCLCVYVFVFLCVRLYRGSYNFSFHLRVYIYFLVFIWMIPDPILMKLQRTVIYINVYFGNYIRLFRFILIYLLKLYFDFCYILRYIFCCISIFLEKSFQKSFFSYVCVCLLLFACSMGYISISKLAVSYFAYLLSCVHHRAAHYWIHRPTEKIAQKT